MTMRRKVFKRLSRRRFGRNGWNSAAVSKLSPKDFIDREASLSIAVVNVSSQEELTEVVSLKDLLDDLATILILPDVNTDNVARAHEIRPRFLACTDSNPIVIAAVLAKMLRKHGNEPIPKGGRKHERRN